MSESPNIAEKLVVAVQNGNRELVESLLSEGADVNAHVGPGLMPLHIARLRGRQDLVQRLEQHGADTTVPMPARERVVDWLFQQVIQDEMPGAAVAILSGNEVVYQQGYGLANLEYKVPITPSTIFHVASVSKQFTAFAIAILADQGKLSLDDPIQKHLPEVPDFGPTVTIRHLVHHTSGIRDQWELLQMAGWRLDDVITRNQIMRLVQRQRELNFAPGEEYLYCNTGYTLLAEIVERLSGQSFRDWTQQHLFQPLGMTATHFHDDHRRIVRNRAYSYAPKGEDGFENSVLSFANVGATSLFTTVQDLMKWLCNFDEPRVGNASVLEQMHQCSVLNNGKQLDYAFGLVLGEYRGLKTVGHGGMDAGFRSHLVRFPDQGFGIAVLSNLASMNPWNLCAQIAEVYLSDQMTPVTPPTPSSPPVDEPSASETPSQQVLTAFEGTYFSDELGTVYALVVRDGKLMAEHQRHDAVALRVADTDRLQSDAWWFRQLDFTRDESSAITGFRLTGGRVRNLWFDRHPTD